MEKTKIVVNEPILISRLDAFLTEALKGQFSRREVQEWIEAGRVFVNRKPAKSSTKLRAQDVVEAEWTAKEPFQVAGEQLPLKIIFEDTELLAIDKPYGMVVHPGAGHSSGTLVNALVGHSKKLSTVGPAERPGIVHRIDKDTSGILLVAKTNLAHRRLQEQFAERSMEKLYTALVQGKVEFQEGHIDAPLGRDANIPQKRQVKSAGDERAKEAQTRYRVLKRFKTATLLEVQILTGRTHQIRVHMAHLGYPVVNDALYGKQKQPQGRLMLHASKITFAHPKTGKIMSLESPLPPDFLERLKEVQ